MSAERKDEMSIATEIEITDIGPIDRLVIPLREGGGVTELRGSQGTGKSTATRAASALLKGHNGSDLTRRDGATLGERGVVQCGDLKLTVGMVTRRSGELCVKEIESSFDLQHLVDPGLKDPAAADRARIKALIGLTGVEPDLELFAELIEAFRGIDGIVSPKTMKCSDLCDMAKGLRADLHEAARGCEKAADVHEGQALACRSAGEGLDLKAEADPVKLETTLTTLIRTQGRVAAEIEGRHDWQKAHVAANARLAEAEASYTGPTAADALLFEMTAKSLCDVGHKTLDEAIETVHRLQVDTAKLEAAHDKAVATTKAAGQHSNALDAFRSTLDQPGPAAPEGDAMLVADDAVTAAKQALETGTLVRDAIAKQKLAKSHAGHAKQMHRQAEALRTAARDTDEVLSRAVPNGDLRVQGERLVLDTARGETYFAELSDGERWKVAIDLALAELERLGIERSTALLTIPQHGWQHLSPTNRKLIHEHARKQGVNILAAQVDDGELRAEPMETSGA